jgi:type III pantothenate kinase
MKVIATGGLSPLFAAGTDSIDDVDDSLTMRGLVEIHALNRGNGRRES